jgi:hypothetical protein
MLSNTIAVVALILSVVTFGLAQRFTSAADRRSRIPVLVFVYESNGYWILRNVGNGPALNITLAIKAKHDDRDWQNPTRIPPIGRNDEFRLSWLGDSDIAVIAASYEDFLTADNPRRSRVYTVSMVDDINRVVPRRELPHWSAGESMAQWEREQRRIRPRFWPFRFQIPADHRPERPQHLRAPVSRAALKKKRGA